MTPLWVTLLVGAVSTVGGVIGGWLVKRTRPAEPEGSRENKIIDQLQEERDNVVERLQSENTKLAERVDKLEERDGERARRELVMYAYITEVHAHFAAGHPPPPPPIPQELFSSFRS